MSLVTGNSTDQTDEGVVLAALLVVVYVEALTRLVSRVFVLNFAVAGPNATVVTFLLAITGWTLAVVGWLDPGQTVVYGGAVALIVGGFALSLVSPPVVALLGAALVLAGATPLLVGVLDRHGQRLVVGVAWGILLVAGFRGALLTAPPYATALGRALLAVVVVATAAVAAVLVTRDDGTAPRWDQRRVSPVPLGVTLIVLATFLAQPHLFARYQFRPYRLTVVAFVLGVVVALALLHYRNVPTGRELAGWGVVYLGSVAVLLYVPHPVTLLASGTAVGSVLLLLAGGSRPLDRPAGSGALALSVGQAVVVLAVFGYVSAYFWPYVPAPLDSFGGFASEILLVVHACVPAAVAWAVLGRHPVADGPVTQSRRAVLNSVAAGAIPLAALGRLDSPGNASGESPITVMTYNIHFYYDDLNGGGHNLTEIREIIEESDADIVGLQETEGARLTMSNVDGVRWLAQHLEYHAVYGEPTAVHPEGVALLSRWPIADYEIVRLPAPDAVPALILIATVESPDGPLSVATTHFIGGGQSNRTTQSEALIDAVADRDPAVVLGDFNLDPTTDAYDTLDGKFTEAWTVAETRANRAGDPELGGYDYREGRVDYVWLKGAWTVSRAGTHGTRRVSDHPAVAATIEPDAEL